MIKADKKYSGVVRAGSHVYEAQTGSLGYQVMLECEDGETDFTIWLTEKGRERAEKNFSILGVTIDKLRDASYLEYGLAQEIEGREVSFGTREETYNGKRSVKVAWIGRKSEGKPAQSAARFFGGKVDAVASQVASPVVGKPEITDEDIPF